MVARECTKSHRTNFNWDNIDFDLNQKRRERPQNLVILPTIGEIHGALHDIVEIKMAIF